MEDITKTGPIGLKGLKSLDKINNMSEEDFNSLLSSISKRSPDDFQLSGALSMGRDMEFSTGQNLGSSIYDKEIYSPEDIQNIQDIRAENQPWYAKIAAGIAKGTVLAGTTFADGIAGTISGAINVLANMEDIADSDSPLREAGSKFISNPISEKLAKINEEMESILPNYYSRAEQEGPWYENIFTANFLGDKFLKNMGFTIGAAYSAKTTAMLASKAMGLKGVRDAFKGAVTTASGKVLNTSSEIAKAYKSGDAFMDGIKLTEDLGKAAKKLRNAEWGLKTIGAVSAAMGEGRIEAINNANPWAEGEIEKAEVEKETLINDIENQLFEEHPEWFGMVPVGTAETGEVTYKRAIITPEGQQEWEKRKSNIEDIYNSKLEQIAKDKAKMANIIFGLNTALLSGSNLWQYGRFISGGYNTGRQAKNLVKGTIKEGFSENKDIARKELARALSNPLVEMNEEMSQAFISTFPGLKYSSELDNFYSAKINPDAEGETLDWLGAISEGIAQTYGNIDTWEEGFLGFLTGALGIPSVGLKKNSNNKNRLSLSLQGELWEGLKSYRQIKGETKTIVDELNKRVQSEDFINYYQGTIRHNKYQNDMEAALEKGDIFDYKNAESSQFVSDAIMFDKAGRLQDLYDMIEEAGNVTEDDIEEIRASTIDKTTGKSFFEGKTDSQVLEHIRKQTENAKNRLDSFVEISNNLKSLYGENISSDHLEELTWMMTQVKDWEDRTESIVSDIKSTIEGKAQQLYDRYGIDLNATLGNIEGILDSLSKDYTVVEELNEIINNKHISFEEGKAQIEALIRDKSRLRKLSGLTLGRELKDIRKRAKSQIDNLGTTEEGARLKQKATSDQLLSEILELKDAITEEKNRLINPIDSKKVADSLIDLIKLYTVRSKFISKYTQLAENPEMFTAEAQASLEETIKTIENREINKAVETSSKATNLQELRKELKAVDANIRSKVLKSLQESDDSRIKDLADTYAVMEDSRQVLTDIINGKEASPETISIANIVNDAFDNSSSLEEALQTVENSKDFIGKEVSDTLDSIMSEYKDNLRSENSTERDSNKPKKKLKKRKSILDIGTDEQEEPKEGDEDLRPRRANPDESIENSSTEELEDIAKGEATLEGATSDEDRKAVKEMAEIELQSRATPPVHSEDRESTTGNSEVNSRPAQPTVSAQLRSWVVTQYDFNELKNRDTRRAVLYEDSRVPELIRLGAFDFVDNGNLADLYHNNNELPIHYISVSSGPLKSTILLAVEATDEVYKFEGINPITAQNGKKYQIVGTLGANNNSDAKEAVADLRNYIEDERGSYKGKYYVSSLTNRIKHLYSGRMVKSTDTETVKQRPLQYILNGEIPYLGVYYKDGNIKIPRLESDAIVVPLNSNNQNPRQGSLWLMTKEADGRYYAKSVKVARFNRQDYDVDANMDSPIMKEIKAAIKTLVDSSKSNYQRALAKKHLKELLYFPEGTEILFNGDVISITGYENNIGEGLVGEEKIEALFEALLDDSLDLRFQVAARKLDDISYVQNLLDSNILTTDILKVHNVNASFDIFMPNLKDGTFVKEESEALGHTGERGINNELAGDTVIHNGKTYRVTNEGIYFGKFRISDQNTIDEILFISKIKEGTVNPIEGNPKLYIGTYSTGEEFGVINYKIKTGEELQELLDKAKSKSKKLEREQNQANIMDAFEATDDSDINVEGISAQLTDEDIVKMLQSEEGVPYVEEAEDSVDFDGAFETTTDDDILGVSNEEGEAIEVQEEKPKTETSKETRSPRLDTQFNPTSTRSVKERNSSNTTFNRLVRSNSNQIRNLGFTLQSFADFVNNSENNLPNIDTIVDQQSFDALLDIIKNCR